MNEVDFLQLLRATTTSGGGKEERERVSESKKKGNWDGKNDNKWREISGYYFIYSLLLSVRCFLWQLIEMKL